MSRRDQVELAVWGREILPWHPPTFPLLFFQQPERPRGELSFRKGKFGISIHPVRTSTPVVCSRPVVAVATQVQPSRLEQTAVRVNTATAKQTSYVHEPKNS